MTLLVMAIAICICIFRINRLENKIDGLRDDLARDRKYGFGRY